jgi:serine/threonine protein kinase
VSFGSPASLREVFRGTSATSSAERFKGGAEFDDPANGTQTLLMELIEGPTLADRLASAAIPIEEALTIARQIAEALEAAHEQGIVHRDLKPANVKVTPRRHGQSAGLRLVQGARTAEPTVVACVTGTPPSLPRP